MKFFLLFLATTLSIILLLSSQTPLINPSANNSISRINPLALPTPTTNVPPLVTIGLVGDLGLGRHITSTARQKNDFEFSFRQISPWLSDNDFTLANLESPIIANCPEGKTGTFTFCGDQQFVPILEQQKLILNLNNNHILNYGIDGLNQTKSFLTNVPNFYDNFLIQNINGIKFGFLGYDFVTYPNLSPDKVLLDVKKYNPDVDWLVVSLHWGNEYLPEAEKWRVNLAHRLVEAGADIIHGHHPHVWQPAEVYQDRPIFYSLGNFIFDQSWSYETSHTNIIRLQVDKNKLISQQTYPVEIKFNSQPQLAP